MTFTFTLAWWHIPLVITVISILWALFWPADDSGLLGVIVRMFMIIPALVISCLAWAISGAFK